MDRGLLANQPRTAIESAYAWTVRCMEATSFRRRLSPHYHIYTFDGAAWIVSLSCEPPPPSPNLIQQKLLIWNGPARGGGDGGGGYLHHPLVPGACDCVVGL